ncbi:MAG: histidine kinase [Bacteroidetes bacterium]|nr:histidine kinase [Bacteroidota bacterium]
MRQIHILILILLFNHVFSQPEVQQDPYLKFDHLTKKEGLSNNYVLDIYQDKYGFIWIGTLDGLNRYDAYDFEIFRHDPADSLSISGNLITSITEDIYGNLWIGTKNGLNKYDYKKNGFQRFYHDDNEKNTLSDDFIRALYADKNGILWIETSDGTLHKYDIAKDSLIKYKHRPPNMINTYFYHKIFEDKKGYLWLGGRNMGILKFDPASCLYYEIMADPKDTTKKREHDVATYYIDSSGTFWISGIDGLYTFDEDKEVFKKMLPVSTFSVREEKNGKLWFGTGSGIYVYEKNTNIFTKHVHSENNPNSLIADHVNKIMIDFSGNIWIGATEGISIYSPTKNKFRHVYHISGNDNTPASDYITTLLQDKNGNIWIGTENDGIDCFDKHFNKIAHYGHGEPSGYQIISDKISVLKEDNEGDIWAGQWSGRGFNIIDPVTNKIGSYSKLTNSLRADWYNDLMQDSRGNYWIGIWGVVGLYLFDKENEIFKDETFTLLNINLKAPVLDIVIDNDLIWFAPVPKCFAAFNTYKRKYNMYFAENCVWLKNLQVNQIFLDKENELWFATNKGLYKKICNPYISFRLYKHDKNGKISDSQENILAIANTVNKKLLWIATANGIELFNKVTKFYSKVCDFPFADIQINFIFQNIDSQLWIGTQSGLYLKLPGEKSIKKHKKFAGLNSSQSEMSVNCYLQEPSGNFWLGTSSGLYYYNSVSKLFEKRSLMNGYEIYSLVFDKSGNLWIGTNKGLYNIKENKIIKSFRAVNSNQNTLAGDPVYSLAFDKYGDLWIGTNKGLCRLEKITGTIIRHNTRQEKYLSSRLIRCIYEDNQSNIWIGTTDKGLNKMEPATGKVIQYLSDLQDSTAFWGKDATCVLQDINGTIWAGGFGLNKYIPGENAFKHYTEYNGLSNNNVMGILEDNSGNLWISTQNGLSKFDPLTETFENFFSKDGLQDNEFTVACCKLKNNYLIFGGKNGMNIFNPEKICKNQNIPNVSISKFMIFDKKTNYEFPQTKTVKLKHNQNYFSFEFAALDFSFPSKNKYAYKLENFDKEWVFTDANDRKAKYTNVPPGEYIFRVRAANNDGTWNKTGAAIELIIKPPFWKTLWFYFLEGLLFVLIIVAYIKYREKKIKEKNKLLLLEQKLLRSQMNPHFIFNSLTSIQSFIFENNPIEAGSYLSKFSELIRAILYNSREEFISLEKEIKTLENYLEIQQLRYNNKFDYEIDVDPEIDIEMLKIPPMLAQPFIENSVEHGIKHIEGKGFISIKFSLIDESIFMIIEDNGIGIEASRKMKDKKAQEHKSLAMIITKERIGILNKGKKKKSYSIHIEDIIGEGGKVKGTRIKFIIPHLKLLL